MVGVALEQAGELQFAGAGQPGPHGFDLHRVGRGESLRSIAHQYGVSVGALKSANRIDSDTIRAGIVLAIPTG